MVGKCCTDIYIYLYVTYGLLVTRERKTRKKKKRIGSRKILRAFESKKAYCQMVHLGVLVTYVIISRHT